MSRHRSTVGLDHRARRATEKTTALFSNECTTRSMTKEDWDRLRELQKNPPSKDILPIQKGQKRRVPVKK